MNYNQQSFQDGEHPFLKINGTVRSVNIPSELRGNISIEELFQVLQSGQKYQDLQGKTDHMDLLGEKATKIEQLEKKLLEMTQRLELRDVLIAKQRTLIDTLLGENLEGSFDSPSFPDDFRYYDDTVGGLGGNQVQEIVNQLAANEIGLGEFSYVFAGNTAVIRMNDGGRIVTVVAQDFYEAEEK
ncbi:hypothetical protein GRF59_05430 [Paenibacillus sp. HJL G12]|uniref:Uncharacterized protein n=1 Tax=Paenibacillus dendrobii TaxID=2691084 RepID=A0A7X3IIB2_9BACL|nr:hypothetical protein [Paenibacillus dendrobii]MWV43065.1 hypothetical protein [Paenibacillus dendrobii]